MDNRVQGKWIKRVGPVIFQGCIHHLVHRLKGGGHIRAGLDACVIKRQHVPWFTTVRRRLRINPAGNGRAFGIIGSINETRLRLQRHNGDRECKMNC